MTDPLNVATPQEKQGFRSEAERQTAERDEVARKNREEMLRLVAKHDLWIRREDFDNWRPTVRVSGDITGVKTGLTIIATDGNVAYFEDPEDFDVFFGHIQCFDGEVRTLFCTQKETGVVKPAKRRQSRVERDAMELLKETQARCAPERDSKTNG